MLSSLTLTKKPVLLCLKQLMMLLNQVISYYSSRLIEEGRKQWLTLLKQAASAYNNTWLAFQLEDNQLLRDFEGAQKPSSGYSIKHVPNNAAETFAEGQFNRFYILGLCKLAKSKSVPELIVYRAKETKNPRPRIKIPSC